MQIASHFDTVPALQMGHISSPPKAQVSYFLLLNAMIKPLRRRLLHWTALEGKHQEGPGESTSFLKFHHSFGELQHARKTDRQGPFLGGSSICVAGGLRKSNPQFHLDTVQLLLGDVMDSRKPSFMMCALTGGDRKTLSTFSPVSEWNLAFPSTANQNNTAPQC